MLFDVLLLLLLLLARFDFDFSLYCINPKTRKQACTVQYSTGITIYSYFRSFALTSLYVMVCMRGRESSCMMVCMRGRENDLYVGVYKKKGLIYAVVSVRDILR